MESDSELPIEVSRKIDIQIKDAYFLDISKS